MEIHIPDNTLAKICNQKQVATKKLGAACARKLRSRLSDLQAAENVLDLCAGNPHPLTGDKKGQYAVSLHGGNRLVFEPDNNPVPCHKTGGINWLLVTKVRIIYIGDYHD